MRETTSVIISKRHRDILKRRIVGSDYKSMRHFLEAAIDSTFGRKRDKPNGKRGFK